MVQILILAAVAAFLFWRLSVVLGTRSGFEKTADIPLRESPGKSTTKAKIENDLNTDDDDISDYVELTSEAGQALKQMKEFDTGFSVNQFVSGAKSAYEIILMAYENGDLAELEIHLANDVFKDFESVVTDRADKGYKVEANFLGVREIRIRDAVFDEKNKNAEITVFFKCELTSVVRDKDDNVIEGNLSEVRKHSDIWTFARVLGTKDPSWKLIATGS